MRASKPSFFRVLARLERLYQESDIYNEDARNTLRSLIVFVQDCGYDTSESRRFISKYFRQTPEEICSLWNSSHIKCNKRVKTFYSQISTFSNDLYAIFGDDIESVFTVLDEDSSGRLLYEDRRENIQDIIDALSIEGLFKEGIFLSDLEMDIQSCEEYEFSLEECAKEIRLMKQFTKQELHCAENGMDRRKAAYILRVVKMPIFQVSADKRRRVAEDKVSLLKEFRQIPDRRIQQEVVMHKDIYALLKDIPNSGEEPDSERVEELTSLIYRFYTEDGFKKFVSKYTKEEFMKAVHKVFSGE